ncbi:MAG: hypothetical protein ACFB16_14985, partial [Phormidesmis sp.]
MPSIPPADDPSENSPSSPDPKETDQGSAASEDVEAQSSLSFPWFWLGTFVGTVFGGIGLGLLVWGWIFVQEDLSPLVARLLSDYLGRPVELGEVENVTFGSAQVGASYIGPSAEDPTTLTADTVIVEVDLLKTLFTSELGLDLTVVGAEGYLAQDTERGWLNLVLPEREEPARPNRFDISVDDLRLQDSELTLVPLPPIGSEPEPILLEQVRGTLNTEKKAIAGKEPVLVRFEVTGEPLDGGEITLKGEVTPIEAVATTDEDGNVIEPENEVAFATNFFIQADEAPLADIIDFTLPTIDQELATEAVTIESGDVSGIMEMSFRPNDFDYSGTIQAKNADIATDILPLPIENASGETQFEGNLWTVDRLSGDYGAIKNVVAEGLIDFDNGYDLTAVKNNVSVDAFSRTIDLELPVPTEGTFDATASMTGPLDNPLFEGNATADGSVFVDKLTFTSASTDFLLQGQQLSLVNIAATPSTGGSIQGNGQVRLGEGTPFTFDLAGRDLPANELAAFYDLNPGFAIGLVSADAAVVGNSGVITTVVDWNAPNALYPGSGKIDITNGTDLRFRETVVAVGGGSVTGSGSLIDQIWDADVNVQAVQLSAFSEELRGDVSGQFQLEGTTADTRREAIAAQGNITFSEGLAAFSSQFDTLNSPLSAQVAWNGNNIQVFQANAARLSANGTLTPAFSNGSFSGLESFGLNVTAQDYALDELPFPIPDVLSLTGRSNVTGRLTGSPTAPNFRGDIQLADLVVNSLAFEPQLAGTIDYTTAAGLALNVAGSSDRIALNAGPFEANNLETNSDAIPPLDFNVNWQGAVAQGRTRGDLLSVTADNFPLAALNFPADGVAGIGQLRGTLSTPDLVVNLADASLNGNIAIDQLGVGYISAGQLVGQVSYVNDSATFTNGELRLSDNLYTVTGSLSLAGTTPTYNASINTSDGDVQDLLTALSIYTLEDFRRGLTPPDWLEDPLSQADLEALLTTVSAGVASQTALDQQLDRLAEIDELEDANAIANAAQPLPPLQELEGPLAGNLQLSGSGSDFQLDFDLTGEQWHWGENYSADTMIAKGALTPNILTLAPVRFSSSVNFPVAGIDSTDAESTDDEATNTDTADTNSPPNTTQPSTEASVDLAGQFVFGQDTELTSDLQANIQNVDITALRDILELPVDIAGRANGLATLSGTLANPQLRGFTELNAASINNTPIDSATAEFLYRNARLILSSALTTDNSENPLTLSAQIPYAFNFMDTQADSEDINIDISVKDDGLALLNIFSNQVAWESGEGQVNLAVGGTLSDIEIAGNASLNNAVISAAVLPEPLTNVNGSADFIDDQIIVEALNGQFSDGQLTAAGIFPLRTSIVKGIELAAPMPTSPRSDIAASPPDTPADTPADTPPEANTTGQSAEQSAEQPVEEPTEPPIEQPANPLFPRPLAPTLPLTVNLEN